MLKDKDTPLPLLRERMKIGKFLFDALDEKEGNDFDLIDFCAKIVEVLPWDKSTNKGMVFDIASEFAALYQWRKHKCIYAFDPDLAEELKRQVDDVNDMDTLPVEILLHLPYPCLYIHCPGLIDESMVGFFAFIAKNGSDTFLVFQMRGKAAKDFTFCVLFAIASEQKPIHTIRDAILFTVTDPDEAGLKMDKDLAPQCIETLTAVQLLLYILSANADKVEHPHRDITDKKTVNTVKRKKIEDKVGEIDYYEVGIRVGAALRAASSTHTATATGTGSAKRPHSRRGHWHHYWIGTKSDESKRKIILKWVAPTFIHAEIADDTTTVIPVGTKRKKEGI